MTLATVWAVNFLLVLPYLNPRFVGLFLYSVTLASKITIRAGGHGLPGQGDASGSSGPPSGRLTP